MSRVRQLWTAILLGLSVVLFTGCSSFNKQWKQSLAQPRDGLNGPWVGTWQSDKNGHHGKLRCIITDNSTNVYTARFHATFFKILRYTYTGELNGRRENNGVKFEGEADLGKLAGGVYKYDGFAADTNFFSKYSAKYDHGTFTMSRPTE